MSDREIKRLSLSFIWTRTFFDLFERQAAQRYPYGFFAKISAHKAKFNELRGAGYDDEGLSLPWKPRRANYFWKYYFGRHPGDLTANLARERYLVPFRKRVKARISTSWLPTKGAVTLEGFFYAHGVAAVLTVRVRNSASLEEALTKAFQARWSASYKVKWNDGSEGDYSLGALAGYLLDSFCQDALGPGAGKGMEFPSGEPFSIATVIQGGSDYRDQLVEQGDETHRALEALASWNIDWPSANPPNLEDKKWDIKKPQDNHYLYGDKKGRALWFPKLFTPPDYAPRIYALGWYHRNLVLASLQTASLGAFLAHTAERLKRGARITVPHSDCAGNAIRALERLSQGRQNTYRTWSTRVQIEQNGFLDAMNYLKTKL